MNEGTIFDLEALHLIGTKLLLLLFSASFGSKLLLSVFSPFRPQEMFLWDPQQTASNGRFKNSTTRNQLETAIFFAQIHFHRNKNPTDPTIQWSSNPISNPTITNPVFWQHKNPTIQQIQVLQEFQSTQQINYPAILTTQLCVSRTNPQFLKPQ